MKNSGEAGKYDLPAWLIRLSEACSRDWHTVQFTESFGPPVWVKGAGNPEARRLQHTWNKFIVLGVARTAMETMVSTLGDVSLVPAVAYHYRGRDHAGKLPTWFGKLNGGETLAVAMREGFRPIEATLGLLSHKGRVLYIPSGVHIVEDLVPAEEFDARYNVPKM